MWIDSTHAVLELSFLFPYVMLKIGVATTAITNRHAFGHA